MSAGSALSAALLEELTAQFRLRVLLTRMGIQVSDAEAAALVSSIDVDGDGLLDFSELVQMVERIQSGDIKLAALRQVMEALDTTPVTLLEREAARFGLQTVYQLLEEDDEEDELFRMQLELVGKVCIPEGREVVRAVGKTTREAKFKAAEAALVKIKKLQPGLAVQTGELPDQWEKWLFANIEKGASIKKVMHTLAQKGFFLTGNRTLMQRISTRSSSFGLRTKVRLHGA